MQIIPGSDVRCIWDGRGVSASAASPVHEHADDSQEAQVHVVMNAPDSTNGPGALKNRSIVQHVCELIPTVQLFPSDTNSTSGGGGGMGQDARMSSSHMSYASQVLPSPSIYASSVNSGFASASGYAPSTTSTYTPSPVGYPSSPANFYPSPNYASSNTMASPHRGIQQSRSSIDLGNTGGGYFSPATPLRPSEPYNSRSWRS